MTRRRLLLISNSTSHGSGYLDHCEQHFRARLAGVERVLFVPFALFDRDGYAATARARLAAMGFETDALHTAEEPRRAVAEADAFFVGGGNTFRLLNTLYRLDLLEPIRRRVAAGAPYIGTSAGSNVACATIRTTNDMPIVQPPSFDALGLVPFNINPHYLDPDPTSTHQGETREQRIREFHEENTPPVLGLRESAMLWIDDDECTLHGTTGARLFQRGQIPTEHTDGERLDFLLG
jgi:dipeptidase E